MDTCGGKKTTQGTQIQIRVHKWINMKLDALFLLNDDVDNDR